MADTLHHKTQYCITFTTDSNSDNMGDSDADIRKNIVHGSDNDRWENVGDVGNDN